MGNKRTESDGLYFFAILLKYKLFIIIITVVAAIASVIIAFSMPVWYASTVNFVPPQEAASSARGGDLGAIMRDFGLAKVGGSNSTEYTLLVFFESRTVIDSIMTKYDIVNAYNMKGATKSDIRRAFMENTEVQYLEEGNYLITVWDQNSEKAAQMANDYVQIANHFIQANHERELAANVEYLTSRIKSIDSAVSALGVELNRISKNKNIYSPEDQAQVAATAIGALKQIAVQQEIIYEYMKSSYGEEDSRTMNAKELYKVAQNKVQEAYSKPGFIGNVPLNEVTPFAIDYITKYVDVEAFTQIKALLSTSLEKAKLDSYSSMPNFFVVDEAIPSDKKDKPVRSLVVAGGTLSGFIISILIILLVNGFKIAFKQSKNLLNESN